MESWLLRPALLLGLFALMLWGFADLQGAHSSARWENPALRIHPGKWNQDNFRISIERAGASIVISQVSVRSRGREYNLQRSRCGADGRNCLYTGKIPAKPTQVAACAVTDMAPGEDFCQIKDL